MFSLRGTSNPRQRNFGCRPGDVFRLRHSLRESSIQPENLAVHFRCRDRINFAREEDEENEWSIILPGIKQWRSFSVRWINVLPAREKKSPPFLKRRRKRLIVLFINLIDFALIYSPDSTLMRLQESFFAGDGNIFHVEISAGCRRCCRLSGFFLLLILSQIQGNQLQTLVSSRLE